MNLLLILLMETITLAFILTAKNLHDSQRVGVLYNTEKKITTSFQFEISRETTVKVLIKKIEELTGITVENDDLTEHGTFLNNPSEDKETVLYSVAVNKIKPQDKKDEFQAKDNTSVRWLNAKEAAESSDWVVPLTIMKILTSRNLQIVVQE